MRAAVMFFIALITFTHCAIAQQSGASYFWKKRTGRVVDLRALNGNSKNTANADSSFINALVRNFKSGKVQFYQNSDFSTTITPKYLDDLFNPLFDTIVYLDSNMAEKREIVAHKMKLDSIHKYKIIEEWSFNPYTCLMESQIAGVAAQWDIYGQNGEYRGMNSLFFIKAIDFLKAIKERGCLTPFYQILVANLTGSSTQIAKIENFTSSETIDLREPQTFENNNSFLSDDLHDGTLACLFFESIKAKKISPIKIGKNNIFFEISIAEIEKSFNVPDTSEILDSETGLELMNCFGQFFGCEPVHKYTIHKSWAIDMVAGKTVVEVVFITSLGNVLSERHYLLRDSPLYAVRFADVKDIIARHDEYHQDNSIAKKIWDSYFLLEGSTTK